MKQKEQFIKKNNFFDFITLMYNKWSEQNQKTKALKAETRIANEKLNIRLKKQTNDLKILQLETNKFNSTQITKIIITFIICATIIVSLFTFISFKKLELNHKLIMIEKMK